MSDFLDNLAGRAGGESSPFRPCIASRFEPLRPAPVLRSSDALDGGEPAAPEAAPFAAAASAAAFFRPSEPDSLDGPTRAGPKQPVEIGMNPSDAEARLLPPDAPSAPTPRAERADRGDGLRELTARLDRLAHAMVGLGRPLRPEQVTAVRAAPPRAVGPTGDGPLPPPSAGSDDDARFGALDSRLDHVVRAIRSAGSVERRPEATDGARPSNSADGLERVARRAEAPAPSAPIPIALELRPQAAPPRIVPEQLTASGAAAAAPPTVNVTIGRIDVRAVRREQPAVAAPAAPKSRIMSLDDYLRRRAGGGVG